MPCHARSGTDRQVATKRAARGKGGAHGIIALDPPTLTFWDDEASLAAWAHRQATHKRQMDRYRTTGNADRASFTRLTALRSSGTWYGQDPVATAQAHGPDS